MPAPDKKAVLKKIRQSGIVPVFYHSDPELCKDVVRACYEGGLRIFEFTNRGAKAQENYIMLKKFAQRELPEMYIGIGTVKDVRTAETFISYNADFVVSPIIDPAVGALCKEKKLLWIPGCNTPTEIALAERNGAELIKLFPGETLGPAFVKAIRPLFPDLHFLPTGGVEPTAGSLISWLEAGAFATGMGRKLITPEILNSHDFSRLKEVTQKLMKAARRWRQENEH